MKLGPGSPFFALAARDRADLGMQRGDHVFARLLEDIAGGRFGPGEKLLIDELAEAYGVSITPVRDALNRLETHGVIMKVPYHGYFVRSFEPREVRDLYEVRAGLEALAISLACERITSEQLARLRELNGSAEEALAADDLLRYQATNQAIHALIFEASGNQLLVRTMGSISVQMQLMVAQTVQVPGRPSRATSEHREMIELLAKRDAPAAEALMKAHVYAALDDLGLELEE